MTLGISTREVMQVLAAIVNQTGPIHLTAYEIENAPMLDIEAFDDGNSVTLMLLRDKPQDPEEGDK